MEPTNVRNLDRYGTPPIPWEPVARELRLHAGIGYVCPNEEHEGRRQAIRKGREAGLERPVSDDSPTIDPDAQQHRQQHRPEGPTMLTDRNGISIAKSETPRPPRDRRFGGPAPRAIRERVW
jgi:hypothetical protein